MGHTDGAVLDVAGREQRQDMLLDLLDEFAIPGCLDRVRLERHVHRFPVRRYRRVLAGTRAVRRRLQYVHLDRHAREWIGPVEPGAPVRIHLKIRARSEVEQYLAQLVAQSVAGVFGGKSLIDEVRLLGTPYPGHRSCRLLWSRRRSSTQTTR